MIEHEIKDSKGGTQTVKLNPLKAIRLQCMEYAGWSFSEVEKCTGKLCLLYLFRFGNNPSHKKEYSVQQRKAMSERMKKIRTKRSKQFNIDKTIEISS